MHIAFALLVLGGFAAAYFLATNGHPWLAFFVLLIVGGSRMKETDSNGKKEEHDQT